MWWLHPTCQPSLGVTLHLCHPSNATSPMSPRSHDPHRVSGGHAQRRRSFPAGRSQGSSRRPRGRWPHPPPQVQRGTGHHLGTHSCHTAGTYTQWQTRPHLKDTPSGTWDLPVCSWDLPIWAFPYESRTPSVTTETPSVGTEPAGRALKCPSIELGSPGMGLRPPAVGLEPPTVGLGPPVSLQNLPVWTWHPTI